MKKITFLRLQNLHTVTEKPKRAYTTWPTLVNNTAVSVKKIHI